MAGGPSDFLRPGHPSGRGGGPARAATTHVCFESVSPITQLQPRRAALLGYVSVTMPLQNCWPLPVSTSYLRTNASLPSPAMR